MQLESILNVSQLAIRAPASPGSTAAILLFSPSLSLRLSSPPPAPQPHSTREERRTISNFQRFAHMDSLLLSAIVLIGMKYEL